MMQMSLLDIMEGPSAEAIRRAVAPDGPVVQGDIDHVFEIPSDLAYPTARIELHRAEDGLWMWATQHRCGGYRVGPKWGKFAVTRFDALFFACRELDETVRGQHGTRVNDVQQLWPWTGGLVHRAAQGVLFSEERTA